MTGHRIAYGLFLAASTVSALLAGVSGTGLEPDVPEEALDALHAGRHWRASRIFDRYLAGRPDTTPGTALLAAEAAAGWGAWATVDALLEGRSWLDTAGGGRGWSLLGRSHWERGRWAEAATALERFEEVGRGVTVRERGLATFRRARALARDGRTREALRLYTRAAGRLPQIRDWIQLFAARAAAAAGDTTTALERLAETGAPERAWGWDVRFEARLAAGDTAGAARAARTASSGGTAAERAGALERLGRLELARGDTTAARNALGRAIAVAPSSIAAIDAARTLSELDLTAEEALAVGRVYLRHGNLDRAIDGLSAYLEVADDPDVRLQLGEALFGAGRFRTAERELLALTEELAETAPATAARALYLAGRAQYRSGRTGQGMATFRRTVERFPGQETAARAAFLLADLSHDAGALDEATRYYRRVVELAPDINESGLAQMRLAGMASLAGEPRRAAELLEAYRSRYPDGRRIGQATYWAGRAYERLGESERARERYREAARREPTGYYGIAAARRLGQTVPELDLEPAPAVPDRAAGAAAAALERIDLLAALDAGEAAGWETDRQARVLDTGEGALYAFAEGLNARGRAAAGITIGWRIREREGAWNPRLLRIIYPFPFREMVLAEARERDLDPFFVAGLIRRESAFDPGAVSPAGAIGLMQVVPRTGEALARGEGVRPFETRMLTDPEINLHLGTAYLAELMDRYDGRLTDVLVAYNAGPTRLERWRDLPEYVADTELFVERIPFGETRDYIRFVQEHASLYAALYGSAEPGADE